MPGAWQGYRLDAHAGLEDVTGDGLGGDGSYLAMGSSGTGAVTVYDVDCIAFKEGALPEPEPEPVSRR